VRFKSACIIPLSISLSVLLSNGVINMDEADCTFTVATYTHAHTHIHVTHLKKKICISNEHGQI
jgi:hypothetical protein